MSLDLHTLVRLLGLAFLLQVAALYAQFRASEARLGLGCWTLGNAAVALGFVICAFREDPRFGGAAIVANNALFLLGLALNYGGIQRFFHREVSVARIAVALGLLLLALGWFTFGQANLGARRMIFSGAVAAQSFLIVRTLWHCRKAELRVSLLLLVAAHSSFGMFFAFRLLGPILGPPAASLSAASPIQVSTYLVAFAGGLLWNFGFIILINQRLHAEGREARERLQESHRFLAQIIENNGALMFVKDLEGRYELVNRRWEEVTGMSRDSVIGRRDVELFPGDVGQAFRQLDLVVMQHGQVVEDEEELPGPGGKRTFISIKFHVRTPEGAVRGICGMATEITERKRDEQRIHELLVQLEIEKVYAQTSAVTDGLTKLANRRQFEDVMHTEFYRHRRSRAPLSLLMADVDHFKAFNDQYGHLAGDDCLRRIAQAIKTVAARASDLPARFGGEEFAVVLPETDHAGARLTAERIRRAVEELGIPHAGNEGGLATLSLGVVTRAGSDLVSVDELIERADEALYRAKEGGRNRVEVAQGSPDQEGPGDLIRLVWRESAECGNALIDAQHKALFQDANLLLSAILEGGQGEVCAAHLENLLTGILNHFRDEEEILQAAGFPFAEQHARIHTELVARAVGLSGKHERGELTLGELFSFLAYDMVAQHMFVEDRKYFPYV